jgi:cholesterol transport system auxiliary component
MRTMIMKNLVHDSRILRRLIKNMVILVSTLALSACSLFTPVKIDQNTFVLNQAPHYVHNKSPRGATLLVATPDTRPVYNTTQMAYSIKPYQVAYFSENHWAETPSQMLQPLLVETMQNTHYFHTVVTPPYIGHYDYMLNTQILELVQDYTCRPAVVRLWIRVQLINATTNRVIATKDFIVCEPILRKTPYGGVIAANQAMETILSRIAVFCLEKM